MCSKKNDHKQARLPQPVVEYQFVEGYLTAFDLSSDALIDFSLCPPQECSPNEGDFVDPKVNSVTTEYESAGVSTITQTVSVPWPTEEYLNRCLGPGQVLDASFEHLDDFSKVDDDGQRQLIENSVIEKNFTISNCFNGFCSMTVTFELDMEILTSPRLTLRTWQIDLVFHQVLRIDEEVILDRVFTVPCTLGISVEIINYPPYFQRWDPNVVVEIVAGERPVRHKLPLTIDPEDDPVEVQLKMSPGFEKLDKFVELSRDQRIVEFDFESVNLEEMGLREGLVHLYVGLFDGHPRDDQPREILALQLTQSREHERDTDRGFSKQTELEEEEGLDSDAGTAQLQDQQEQNIEAQKDKEIDKQQEKPAEIGELDYRQQDANSLGPGSGKDINQDKAKAIPKQDQIQIDANTSELTARQKQIINRLKAKQAQDESPTSNDQSSSNKDISLAGMVQFSNDGLVELLFNMNIYVDEQMDQLQIKADNQIPTIRSLTPEQPKKIVDLSKYLEFTLILGDKDKDIDPSQYTFSTQIESFKTNSIMLSFTFENPLIISCGPIPDEMQIEFIDTSLFISSEFGQTLPSGMTMRFILPKQFPDDQAKQRVDQFIQTSIIATGTALITQILVSVSIKVPLGMMWNLLNVMQIVAYLRLFANWATNVRRPLEYVWEAITMTQLSETILTIFKTKYQKAQTQIQNRAAVLAGVQNRSLFMSLGIFGIIFVGLCILVVIYFTIKKLGCKSKAMVGFQSKLRSMLFFNSFIRYLIKSNLVLTHNTFIFLAFLFSFNTVAEAASTLVKIGILLVLIAWPILISWFLIRNQALLESENFKDKYHSLYFGIKTTNPLCLTYNSAFCARRFLLATAYVSYALAEYNLVYLILLFQLVQSAYILFIVHTKPHIDTEFYTLELINEALLVVLMYIGLWSTFEYERPDTQWTIGYIAICHSGLIIVINLALMVMHGFKALSAYCKKRRSQARAKEQSKSAKLIKLNSQSTAFESRKALFQSSVVELSKVEELEEVEKDQKSQSSSSLSGSVKQMRREVGIEICEDQLGVCQNSQVAVDGAEQTERQDLDVGKSRQQPPISRRAELYGNSMIDQTIRHSHMSIYSERGVSAQQFYRSPAETQVGENPPVAEFDLQLRSKRNQSYADAASESKKFQNFFNDNDGFLSRSSSNDSHLRSINGQGRQFSNMQLLTNLKQIEESTHRQVPTKFNLALPAQLPQFQYPTLGKSQSKSNCAVSIAANVSRRGSNASVPGMAFQARDVVEEEKLEELHMIGGNRVQRDFIVPEDNMSARSSRYYQRISPNLNDEDPEWHRKDNRQEQRYLGNRYMME